MGILTLIKQEYGPTATLEQVIESHPSAHLKAQQISRHYSQILPHPLGQKRDPDKS